ncbi:MAG: hypothetical protein SPL65_08455, partial [Lachnospiraceae bacterium]|nr:hypothetical protein [Lachnospiraceae bacterium]
FVFGHLGSSCSAGAAGQTTKQHYSLSEGLSSAFFSERLTSALTFGGVELSNSIHAMIMQVLPPENSLYKSA